MSTINSLFHWTALLAAEGDPFRGMGAGFRGENAQFHWSDAAFLSGLVAAVPILLWILARLLPKGDKLRQLNSPPQLLLQLARAHGLDRSTRRLMRKLAEVRQLQHPGLLFLEPQLLGLEGLPAAWKKREPRLNALRARLFANNSPQAPAPPPENAATCVESP